MAGTGESSGWSCRGVEWWGRRRKWASQLFFASVFHTFYSTDWQNMVLRKRHTASIDHSFSGSPAWRSSFPTLLPSLTQEARFKEGRKLFGKGREGSHWCGALGGNLWPALGLEKDYQCFPRSLAGNTWRKSYGQFVRINPHSHSPPILLQFGS